MALGMTRERHGWQRAIQEVHDGGEVRVDESMVATLGNLLARAIDPVDCEVLKHGARVAHIAVQLGVASRRLGDAELHTLRMAALYHDIGKLKLPKAMVHKPGPLDVDEWSMIREHPILGQALVEQMPGLDDARLITAAILHHHEAWDGSGYPAGLRKHHIPFHARIIAVADTWDALRTRRSYKAPHAREHAMEVMRDDAGRRLDPLLVELLLGAA